jgi:uncharacterized protein (DUF2235 family)
MAKNVVFLADGTWNGPGQPDEAPQTTNVFKLFGLLAGSDSLDTLALQGEQERQLTDAGRVLQVAKYLHGVGDSRNPVVRLFGGAFGAGVIARIVRGYTFVSRHCDDGDRIVLVGFSRGAYTVRALAGLIAGQGLLPAQDCADPERAYRLGAAVWAAHRSRRDESAQGKSLLHRVLSDLPSFMDPSSVRAERPSAPLRPAEIACVGVWDTVGALGIPITGADDQRLDVFQFCDRVLSPKVRRGYHAVSLDEERGDFAPTLWEPRDGVTQVLFAGAHADVGGGYPLGNGESLLAHLALDWMSQCLRAEGLRFGDSTAADRYRSSPFGPSHQPWTEFPWTAGRAAPRHFAPADRLAVHPALQQRCECHDAMTLLPSGAHVPYRPPNLPPRQPNAAIGGA